MKTILLLISITLSLFVLANEGIKSVLPYTIISDTVNEKIPQGKCLIQGHVGDSVAGVQISYDDKKLGMTNSKGYFRVMVDTSVKHLQFNKLDYETVYFENYSFANQHDILIHMHFPLLTDNMYLIVDKPVLYLYDAPESEITVKLQPKGDFTFTYPSISENNEWIVNVENQLLEVDGKQFPYLFYETKQENLGFSSRSGIIEGTFVKKDEVVSFLENTLSTIGLNSREKTDFITFWGPKMVQHDEVFVQFFWGEDYDLISTVQITPQPESSLRLFMVYAEAEGEMFLPMKTPQEFEPFERKGFTLVEWGGSFLPYVIINNP